MTCLKCGGWDGWHRVDCVDYPRPREGQTPAAIDDPILAFLRSAEKYGATITLSFPKKEGNS